MEFKLKKVFSQVLLFLNFFFFKNSFQFLSLHFSQLFFFFFFQLFTFSFFSSISLFFLFFISHNSFFQLFITSFKHLWWNFLGQSKRQRHKECVSFFLQKWCSLEWLFLHLEFSFLLGHINPWIRSSEVVKR